MSLVSRARDSRPWLGAIALACVAFEIHCAKSDESVRFADDAGEAPDGSAAESGVFADGGAKPIENVECAEDTKQIYVLGTDKTLYRFYPDRLEFKRIGTLDCPTVAGTFSMAIDRRGIAWVEFTDGRLFAVDTSNATCTPTAFRPGQTGFTTFGMGFAKNGPDPSSGETLYAAGAGLAAIDTKTFALDYRGSLAFGRTELTGLDTQLFAFSVGSGVIAGLDKTTAATEVVYRTTAIDPSAAFAFAHWGGDFWIFTGNVRSTVTRYSPVDDVSTVAVEDAGMLIVGAGSSTCAPTKRPN